MILTKISDNYFAHTDLNFSDVSHFDDRVIKVSVIIEPFPDFRPRDGNYPFRFSAKTEARGFTEGSKNGSEIFPRQR